MDATELFAPLGPTYDRWGAVLSFGQDPRWRRFLVSRIDAGPTDTVLDVATGTAAVALELVRQKDCFVVGVDQTRGCSTRDAGASRSPRRREKVRLQEGDARSLPFADGQFDALTFTYLLRYVDDPPAVLRELARVRQAGRDDRRSRVRRAERHLAAAVGALDTRRPAGRRPADRQRLARGRLVPRPVDPRASTSAGRSPRLRAAWREAGIERRRDATAEPRRRGGDVGTREKA